MPEEKKKKSRLWFFAAAGVVLLVVILLLLTRCGEKAPDWQEQYDLGLRYLSEGNYEEAILAFSAAIDIDPNVSNHYLYRGDAYVMGAEDHADRENYDTAEEYLQKAEEDYNKAKELAPENEEIDDRLENLENLAEELIPEPETEPPTEPPYYEEADLEIDTAPDSTEAVSESALRQGSWTGSYHSMSYLGYQDGVYEVAEARPYQVSLSVQEFAPSASQQLISEYDEESGQVLGEFLESNPGSKLITADFLVSTELDLGPYKYSLRIVRVGAFDRYSGIVFQPPGRYGSTTISYGGNSYPVMACYVSGSGWREGAMVYSAYTLVLLVPEDYDGAVFFAGYNTKEEQPIYDEFPYYADTPGAKYETLFFALP